MEGSGRPRYKSMPKITEAKNKVLPNGLNMNNKTKLTNKIKIYKLQSL